MPLPASQSITYSVRLTTRKDGRVEIIGSKAVRMLLSSCGFPLRTSLFLRAKQGRIILASSVGALYEESAKITSNEAP